MIEPPKAHGKTAGELSEGSRDRFRPYSRLTRHTTRLSSRRLYSNSKPTRHKLASRPGAARRSDSSIQTIPLQSIPTSGNYLRQSGGYRN